jgi:phosphoglycolate phosphatase
LIKAVLLDFDGTLASSLPGIWNAMSRTLADHGFLVPGEQSIRETIGMTLEDSICALTKGVCVGDAALTLAAYYRNLHDSHIVPLTQLFDGVVPLLRELKQRKIFSVVVSNKGRTGLTQLLEANAIVDLLDLSISATDVPYRKPDPRLFHDCIMPISRFGPAETMVVGDTPTDLQFSRNIGATSCWARYGYGNVEACRRLEPEFEIDAPLDLLRFLNGCR